MTKPSRSHTLAAWLLACGFMACQPAQAVLALSGPPLALANQAYRAYARGNWDQAEAKVREAIRQRPDSAQLRTLLKKVLAARTEQQRAVQQARAAAQQAQSQPPSAAPSPATAPPPVELAQSPMPQVPAPAPSPAPSSAPSPASVPVAAPPRDVAYDAATTAYAAYARADYALALQSIRQALALKPDNRDWRLLEMNALLQTHQLAQAQESATLALASQPADTALLVQRGTIHQHLGQDALAVQDWKAALAIDDAAALKLRMDPQLHFQVRRSVAEVSRESGTLASLSYRGPVSGQGLSPGAQSVQAGVETYWRPWGYRDGRYVELFARAFQTLYAGDGGATGPGTRVAALGIRYRPLRDANLVASFSRVLATAGGRDDWLAQLGYSTGAGEDLRVDTPAWWTTRVSAEAGHYLSAHQTYALGQVQAGRSYRVGAMDNAGTTVVFPHVSLAADYDSNAVDKTSLGVGPGVGMRHWFRGDTFNAPRSYVELTLQYRWRLAGAQRAGGTFVNATLSY